MDLVLLLPSAASESLRGKEQDMATLTTTDVEALFEDLCRAWNRGDAHSVAAVYAPDARLVTPFGDEFDGRDAIRDAYVHYFGGLLAGTQTQITTGKVRHLGADLFIVDATQSITGPLGDLHLTGVVRQSGDMAQIVELRPYAFLTMP
jgi:uncharacterized protein (TIGR02246 family)